MFKEAAGKLASWTPSRLHPRLLFTGEELPLLRRKMMAVGKPGEPAAGLTPRALASRAMQLAFKALVEDDGAALNKAEEAVAKVLELDDWVMPPHRPLRVDLGVAGVTGCLALVYDWLYDSLEKGLRKEIGRAIVERGIRPFTSISASRGEWWAEATHNWRSVICGNMGLAALAVASEYCGVQLARECLVEAVKGVVEYLDTIGCDGGYYEGVGYWGYGVGEAVKFAAALRRLTGVNLFEHPSLRTTGDFALHTTTPDMRCFNFADCGYMPPNSWLLAKLAAEYRNPWWQWLAWRLRSPDPFFIIFFDDRLRPEKPRQRKAVFHSVGIAVTRTGWDSDAGYVGLKTGRVKVNHSHLDVNSFVFYAYGRRIIRDLGSWPYTGKSGGFFDVRSRRWDFEANSTVGHNTLLVDGQGQVYSPESHGVIVKTVFGETLDLLIGEGAAAYGGLLERFRRWLVFLKPATLVVVDDVKANGARRLETLLHPDGELSLNGDITIRNGDVAATVTPLKPSPLSRVIAVRRSLTTYVSRRGPVTQENVYLSISPLHKTEEFCFITVIQAYRLGDEKPAGPRLMEEDDGRILLEVVGHRLELNLERLNYRLEKLT